MENGSSELSIHEQDIYNSEGENMNNFSSQNSIESLSTFITSLQQLEEEIEYKLTIVDDAIKTLNSFKDYKKSPPESEFESAFDDADKKEPDFEVIDKVLQEFIDNISDIKQLLLYIDDQIEMSHIQLKHKKERNKRPKPINLESDTTSEPYRDENDPKTKQKSAMRSKMKEAEESALAARQQINQLVDEINQLQYKVTSSPPPVEETDEDLEKEELIDQNLQNYYEAEIARFNRILSIQQKEVEEMTQVRDDCEKSIEELQEQKKKQVVELNEKTAEISEIKREMNNCERAIIEIKKLSPQLANFNVHLKSAVEDLEKIVGSVKSQLEKLNLQYQNYQEIVKSYDQAQEVIKQNRLKQDEVIQKLIEATDLSDKTLEEIHRYRVERDGYADEIQNLNKLIENVKQKLDIQVEEMDKSAKDYYSGVLYKLDTRLNEAKAENSNFIREKEFLLVEIQDCTKKNQTLKETTGQKSRDEYLAEIFNFNDNCREITNKMIEIHQDNVKTKKRIDEFNSNNKPQQVDVNFLNAKAQQIKMSINQVCSNIGSIESQNQSNNEINMQLKKYLAQKKKEMESKTKTEIESKQKEIQNIQAKIAKIAESQQSELILLQNQINDFQTQAKTSKSSAEQSNKITQERLDKLDSQVSNLSKSIKKLEKRQLELAEIYTRTSNNVKDVATEINNLNMTIAKKNSHEKRRNEQIKRMEVQRLELESDINKAKMLIARLDEEIAAQIERNNRIDIRLENNQE